MICKEDLLKIHVCDALEKALNSFSRNIRYNTEAFLGCLGKKRAKQYLCFVKLKPATIYKFLTESKKSDSSQKVIVSRLLKSEINLYLELELKKLNLHEIYLQGYNKFDENKLAEDIEAYFNSAKGSFIKVNKNTRSTVSLPKGRHLFITSARRRLEDSIIDKVACAVKKCENVHVYIPSDTILTKKQFGTIHNLGADILRADVSRQMLSDEVLNKRESFEYFEKKSVEYLENNKKEIIDIEKPVYKLVCSHLGTLDKIEVDAIIYALGEDRIKRYLQGDSKILHTVYKFFRGETSNVMKIRGHEFNEYVEEMFKGMGLRGVKAEVVKNNVCVDESAYLKGTEGFKKILPGGVTQHTYYVPGQHFFEAKSGNIITSDKMEQFYREKHSFENLHIIVPCGTKISEIICSKLNNMCVDIIEAPVSKDDLENIVHSFKNKFEEYKTNILKRANADNLLKVIDHSLVKYYIEINESLLDIENYLTGRLVTSAREKLVRKKLLNMNFDYSFISILIKNKIFDIRRITTNKTTQDGRVNINAKIDNQQPPFRKLEPNGDETVYKLPCGEYLFVTNYSCGVSDDMLQELKELSKQHSNVHLVTFLDIYINKKTIQKIYDMGIKIIVSDILQKDALGIIIDAQKKFEKLNKKAKKIIKKRKR